MARVMSTRGTPPSTRAWLLRRADQAAVAALLALALVAMAVYWLVQGGWPLGNAGRRLIEIDREPRRTAQYQIDINAAPWPEFTQLPRVGEALAKRIVESRERDGPFQSHEQLQRVPGIGPRTLEGMRPYLRPMAPPTPPGPDSTHAKPFVSKSPE
jgi:competence protein ComEA